MKLDFLYAFFRRFVLKIVVISVFSFQFLSSFAQPDSLVENRPHELTIYVIPSAKPLDWESPASLYKSFIRGYVTTLLKKEKYLLGHLFIKLSSPLLDSTLVTGMASGSKKEKRVLYLKEKVGMGILGVALQGRLDTRAELEKKMERYSRKNRIAFITYRITENAARRIIEFYRTFSSESETDFSPSHYYGGAFWPRYEYEGAGCTAFGLAMLDLAGLLDEETAKWSVSVNIPMDIIGGEVNNNLKIRSRAIKKHKSWNPGDGVEEVDYVPFTIYDPSIIFHWIAEQRTLPAEVRLLSVVPAKQGRIPGLFADRSRLEVNFSDPVMQKRKNNFFFIRPYLKKIGLARVNNTDQSVGQ